MQLFAWVLPTPTPLFVIHYALLILYIRRIHYNFNKIAR